MEHPSSDCGLFGGGGVGGVEACPCCSRHTGASFRPNSSSRLLSVQIEASSSCIASAIGDSGSLVASSCGIGSGLHRGSPSCGCILFICLCVFTEINPRLRGHRPGRCCLPRRITAPQRPLSGRKWLVHSYIRRHLWSLLHRGPPSHT